MLDQQQAFGETYMEVGDMCKNLSSMIFKTHFELSFFFLPTSQIRVICEEESPLRKRLSSDCPKADLEDIFLISDGCGRA